MSLIFCPLISNKFDIIVTDYIGAFTLDQAVSVAELTAPAPVDAVNERSSLSSGAEEPTSVKELIDEKTLADAPIAVYKGEGVQKGVGRFGPFIKWNGVFINVSRKYNFDNLSQSDIEELIEDKLQKNIDKVIHDWKEEGIIVEKARWGRSVILKGKLKIELSKDIDAANLTLAEVQEMIAKKTPAKKTAAKKPAAKKAVSKKK